MERLFKKYRHKIVQYPDCELIIIGYDDDYLIGATKTKTQASFRKTDRATFIEEIYKDPHFRYLYVDESTLLQQYPKIK
jgi:hypothetical protein